MLSTQPSATTGTAFYCVADRRHFIGLAALVNSLRLVGHDEQIFLVDAGITEEQRQLVESEVTVLTPPEPLPPVYLAPVGPELRPSKTCILIDADMIVLRKLDDVIALAEQGAIVGFINDPPNDVRHFPEWAPALDLPAIREQPYLNAGLFVVPQHLRSRLLEPWQRGQKAIDYGGTRYGKASLDDPFYFADQDVVNAVLASEFTADEIVALPHEEAPHFPLRGVRVVDAETLRCEDHVGNVPYLLHHTMTKPWMKATPTNAYSRLLPRVLLDEDVPIRLEESFLPTRLRRGTVAGVERIMADVYARSVSRGRRELGRFGVRTKLKALRGRSSPPVGRGS